MVLEFVFITGLAIGSLVGQETERQEMAKKQAVLEIIIKNSNESKS